VHLQFTKLKAAVWNIFYFLFNTHATIVFTAKILKKNTQPKTPGHRLRKKVAIFSYTFLLQTRCGKNWTRRIWENTRRREDAVLAVSHNSTSLAIR
jgi:hypothetical protein